MKKLFLSLTLILGLSPVAFADGNGKEAIVKDISNKCKEQYKQANNPQIPDQVYIEFCDCLGITYGSKLTEEDLTQVANPATISKELKIKMAEIMQPCSDEFSNKMSQLLKK